MSRAKGERLLEQTKKLAAIERYIPWASGKGGVGAALGASPAARNNWLDNKPIRYETIGLLSNKLGITRQELVSLKFVDFCAKLNIPLEGGTFEPAGVFERREDINTHDVDLMRKLSGEYSLLYLCRDRKTPYLRVERLEIGAYDDRRRSNPIRQIENFNTNTSPSGWLRITNERLVAVLTYNEAYYPETIYYGMLTHERVNIVYGVYVDIELPTKQIFAVRFLMFPSAPTLRKTRAVPQAHQIFDLCYDFLKDENMRPDQMRFVIPLMDRPIAEQLVEAVDTILKMDESQNDDGAL